MYRSTKQETKRTGQPTHNPFIHDKLLWPVHNLKRTLFSNRTITLLWTIYELPLSTYKSKMWSVHGQFDCKSIRPCMFLFFEVSGTDHTYWYQWFRLPDLSVGDSRELPEIVPEVSFRKWFWQSNGWRPMSMPSYIITTCSCISVVWGRYHHFHGYVHVQHILLQIAIVISHSECFYNFILVRCASK